MCRLADGICIFKFSQIFIIATVAVCHNDTVKTQPKGGVESCDMFE